MPQQPAKLWKLNDQVDVHGSGADLHDPKVFETIETSVEALNGDLRALSLDISGLGDRYPHEND